MWSCRAATCRSRRASIAPQFAAQVGDPLLHQTPVHLQLLLAGAAHSYPGFDPRQVRPQTFQTRQRVFQLSQFHRQAGFVRAGIAGENIQDQFGPVDHLDLQLFFQVAGLRGVQVVVKDDHIGLGGRDQLLQFSHLAVAQVGRTVGHGTALRQFADDHGAGRRRQAAQFGQGFLDEQVDRW